MKRLLGAFLALTIWMSSLPAASAVGASASAAVLMDAGSGRVLYEQNAHQPRLIASTTKLMTALVALESGHDLGEEVTIRREWAGAEGSSIYLQPGEKVTLEALLYGMLLRSGNDAALAVAGHCGGTVEEFVVRMNDKARELGMENSSFANPNGLDAEGHYSSAYDMALLARSCLENETLAQMVSTRTITLGVRTFTNHNKLLWRYAGCIGLKTGFTEKAGRTLVSAAEREGLALICVTLNDPNDWSDHAALFDYGFSTYRAEPAAEEGEVLCRVPTVGSLTPFCPAAAGEGLSLCLASGEEVKRELRLDRDVLEGPLTAGTQIGEAVYYLQDKELGRVPLVTARPVSGDRTESRDLLSRLRERLDELSG